MVSFGSGLLGWRKSGPARIPSEMRVGLQAAVETAKMQFACLPDRPYVELALRWCRFFIRSHSCGSRSLSLWYRGNRRQHPFSVYVVHVAATFCVLLHVGNDVGIPRDRSGTYASSPRHTMGGCGHRVTDEMEGNRNRIKTIGCS